MAKRDETGASLVEFALVLPVFMMLLLGMLTGGLAYSRKLSIAQGTREGARYGATLPITTTLPSDVDVWLNKVAAVTITSSDGELESNRPGQRVCVAYVRADGTAQRRLQVGTLVTRSAERCIASDGRDGETRVQVVTARRSTFEALVFSRALDLRSHAVARYEAQQ